LAASFVAGRGTEPANHRKNPPGWVGGSKLRSREFWAVHDREKAIPVSLTNHSSPQPPCVRGNPVANEAYARFWAGAREVVGVASLRNLPITIIPGLRDPDHVANERLPTSLRLPGMRGWPLS
jgi:hypothetical protein